MATNEFEQRFDAVVGRRSTHGHRRRARRGSSQWDDPLKPVTLSQLIKEDGLEDSTGGNEGVSGTQKDRIPSDWPPPFGSIAIFNLLSRPSRKAA